MGERVAERDSVTAVEGPGVCYILHRLSEGKMRWGVRRILEVRGKKQGGLGSEGVRK